MTTPATTVPPTDRHIHEGCGGRVRVGSEHATCDVDGAAVAADEIIHYYGCPCEVVPPRLTDCRQYILISEQLAELTFNETDDPETRRLAIADHVRTPFGHCGDRSDIWAECVAVDVSAGGAVQIYHRDELVTVAEAITCADCGSLAYDPAAGRTDIRKTLDARPGGDKIGVLWRSKYGPTNVDSHNPCVQQLGVWTADTCDCGRTHTPPRPAVAPYSSRSEFTPLVCQGACDSPTRPLTVTATKGEDLGALIDRLELAVEEWTADTVAHQLDSHRRSAVRIRQTLADLAADYSLDTDTIRSAWKYGLQTATHGWITDEDLPPGVPTEAVPALRTAAALVQGTPPDNPYGARPGLYYDGRTGDLGGWIPDPHPLRPEEPRTMPPIPLVDTPPTPGEVTPGDIEALLTRTQARDSTASVEL